MASGDTLFVWDAPAGKPTTSSGAKRVVRNQHDVLEFPDASDTSAVFKGVMPAHYDGGGVEVILHVTAKTATSGTARFITAFERTSAIDKDADDFATGEDAGIAVSGTSGIEAKLTITHTNGAEMDSVVAGDEFRLKVTRDGDGTTGTDDLTDPAQITTIELKEV